MQRQRRVVFLRLVGNNKMLAHRHDLIQMRIASNREKFEFLIETWSQIRDVFWHSSAVIRLAEFSASLFNLKKDLSEFQNWYFVNKVSEISLFDWPAWLRREKKNWLHCNLCQIDISLQLIPSRWNYENTNEIRASSKQRIRFFEVKHFFPCVILNSFFVFFVFITNQSALFCFFWSLKTQLQIRLKKVFSLLGSEGDFAPVSTAFFASSFSITNVFKTFQKLENVKMGTSRRFNMKLIYFVCFCITWDCWWFLWPESTNFNQFKVLLKIGKQQEEL